MRIKYRQTDHFFTRPLVASLLLCSVMMVMAMLGAINTASAQSQGELLEPGTPSEISYERFAFDAADSDGDGGISEAELTRDAAAGFSSLDVNRSGTLTPDELATHEPKRFDRVDTNGDGELTFIEVMTYKSKAFSVADKDQDGKLSYEEMYNAVAAELEE